MLGSTALALPVGYSMDRRLDRLNSTLVGLSLATLLAAGCGGQIPSFTTAPPSGVAAASTGPSGTPGASAGHPSPTVSPSPGQTYPLAHVNAALEDELPSVVGEVTLTKWSMPVSSYIASVTGGDSVLYPAWLVKFGKTPDEVDMALAQDLTGTQNANLRAIQVPGA
ncbi:MAG TPA: hypothetical protein VIK06_09140, partial [Candidatus Limnocylindrales bacterium]